MIIQMNMCFANVTSGSAFAAGVIGQWTWETTLQARDLDGNPSTIEAYCDTTLGITWLADANFAQASGFDPTGAWLRRGRLVGVDTRDPWGEWFAVAGRTGHLPCGPRHGIRRYGPRLQC